MIIDAETRRSFVIVGFFGVILAVIMLGIWGISQVDFDSLSRPPVEESHQIFVIDRTIDDNSYYIWAEDGNVYGTNYLNFKKLTFGWHEVKLKETPPFNPDVMPFIEEVIS